MKVEKTQRGQVGSRPFQRPTIRRLDQPEQTTWPSVLLPEFIWIAALHRTAGVRPGTELAKVLAAVALEVAPDSRGWFAAASDYVALDPGQKSAIIDRLERNRVLEPLRRGLATIHSIFPQSPLRFLGASRAQPLDQASRTSVREWLARLQDEEGREAVRVQATAIQLGFNAGRLQTGPGAALKDVDELEKFPGTRRSRNVVAALRTALPIVVMDPEKSIELQWSSCFWKHACRLGLADSP